MDARELRRKQLDEKKRQLAELRARKKAASAAEAAPPQPPTEPQPSSSSASTTTTAAAPLDVDVLLADLRKKTPVADSGSQAADDEVDARNPAIDTGARVAAPRRAPVVLSVARRTTAFTIAPKAKVEVERYDRSTQTDFAVEASCQADQSDTDAPATAVMTPKKRAVHRPLMTTKTTSPALGTAAATTAATMTDVGNTAAAAASPGGGVPGQSQSNTSQQQQQQHDTSTAPLAPEEKSVIESSDDFEAFLRQTTRVVERSMTLNDMYDVTVDYGGEGAAALGESNDSVTVRTELVDANRVGNYAVSNIAWSPQHSELMLASYSKREAGGAETDWRGASSSDGLVLVWNLRVSDRPEYEFVCQSEVESVIFHPFAPNLIVGGTYSGQVVIWDLRAKAAPVQRSALSFDGHTHPIYSMACVGTSNAHSLVTASTNGQLCMWSTSNLSTPTDSQMLRHHDNKRGDVAVTRLSFPAGESNSYAVGAEDGSIYRGQLHGNTSGLQTRYQAHHGPVTALDYNNSKTASASSLLSSDTNGAGGVAGASAGAAAAGVGGSAVTCDLLLSSSMDWTVKLWSHRHSDVVLKTFESATDYVYDVKWSPVHPALFACVDGAGMLDLWNINVDAETPVERVNVSSTSALSAVRWGPDGRQLVTGDSRGKLVVHDVAAEVALPTRDEWTRLEYTISDMSDDLAQA